MPSSFLSDSQQGSMSFHGSSALSGASSGSSSSATTEAVATPQAAVEAALSAAETLSNGNGSSVSLNFQVGDNSLNVSVELRNGELHTTFKTDSADLRQELAREWQSVGSGTTSLPIATPVITSSSTSQDALAGGGGNHPGRGRESESSEGSFSYGSRSQSSAAPAAAVQPSAPVALPSSSHLLTFA